MTRPRSAAAAAPFSEPSSTFADDEPVLQSHPLIDGVEVPVFGRSDAWSFLATRKPANATASEWRATFWTLPGRWNLWAREVAMAMLNPQHPALIAAGINRGPEPARCNTVNRAVFELRWLADWATERGLPEDLSAWQDDDVRAWVEDRRATVEPTSLVSSISAARLLHQFAPILTGGGLVRDPWAGKSAREVADFIPGTVQTPNIEPEVWHALVKAAWTYIHVFAPDILKAQERASDLEAAATRNVAGLEDRVLAYLADPANIVPLHSPRYPTYSSSVRASGLGDGIEVNWMLLGLFLGMNRSSRVFVHTHKPTSNTGRARAAVVQAVREGRGRFGGLIESCATVTRPDGTIGPWHPGLSPRAVCAEMVNLRAACYIMVAALSMMRDSEIREITKGSVVEHYGAPAIASMKRKHDPNLPREHWWIIEPVAEAIAVAEAISRHDELVFSGDVGLGSVGRVGQSRGFDSNAAVKNFIVAVNRHSEFTGLHIPAGRAAPHMFRKTMAMLTATEPNSEIALGLQLKHVALRALANRSTGGYMASDAQWARLLDSAVDEIRFTRLRELYDEHHAGKTIGFGPGAEKLKATFDAVKSAAAARNGDARVEHDLLRKARISVRFGKLNHCTFDEANPAGAKCLEKTILPPGHTGPLIDRCRPGKCPNSVIGIEHIKIWTAERDSLSVLIAKPGLPGPRKANLQEQFEEAESVIARIGQ